MLDAYLMLVRTSARWRSVVVVQAAVGGTGGAICAIFLALMILNLAIWVAIVALALVLLGMMFGAMAGG